MLQRSVAPNVVTHNASISACKHWEEATFCFQRAALLSSSTTSATTCFLHMAFTWLKVVDGFHALHLQSDLKAPPRIPQPFI